MPEPAPIRRADATRNRERILDAAREAFAAPEADVSMAEVARRAGVGSATLYRNFASRRELLEALYVDEIDAMCAVAEQLDGDAPGDDLEAWLRRFHAYFSGKRLVAEALLEHASSEDAFFSDGRIRLLESGRPVLERARAAGEARTDLDLGQMADLVAAIAKIPGDDARREPILRAALDSLRSPVAPA